MKKKVIDKGSLLESYLKEIVNLSVGDAIRDKQLDDQGEEERRRQERMRSSIDASVQDKMPEADEEIASGDPSSRNNPDNGAPKRSEEEPPPPENDEISDEPPPEEVTLDAVQDKLNIIRSGKSLDDSEIKEEMQKYIDELEESEKVALYSFLKAIGQIVAQDVSGDRVKEPDNV